MNICNAFNCERPTIARGLCTKHYQAAKAANNLPPLVHYGRTRVPVTHPLYVVWGSMKTRCTNPNSKSYVRYGALGITYEPRWEDFNNFYDDMHEGYAAGFWLDRIDSELGYSKSNCRWITPTESNRNRKSVKVTAELARRVRELYTAGNTQTVLAERFGLDQTTISDIVRYKSWANV